MEEPRLKLKFSKAASDLFLARKPLVFEETFGPMNLVNVVSGMHFDNFVHTQYTPIYYPGTSNIDVSRSPIISKVSLPTVNPKTQLEFLLGRGDEVVEIKKLKPREAAVEVGADPSIQCKSLYKKMGKPPPSDCWLCGFPLNTDPDGSTSKRASTQCEHILPAAAALVFHGLIDDVGDIASTPEQEFYLLNYDLAHAECNFPKKDTLLFITLFYKGFLINADPQINRKLIETFLTDLIAPLKATGRSLVQDFITSTSARVGRDITQEWMQRRRESIVQRLEPLLFYLKKSIGLWMLIGAAKLIENIDYMYSKYAVPGGVVFPVKAVDGSWNATQIVKSKQQYRNFIENADSKSALPNIVLGGRRKRTRRNKHGKFSTSRRRIRSKNGNRKNTKSNRK